MLYIWRLLWILACNNNTTIGLLIHFKNPQCISSTRLNVIFTWGRTLDGYNKTYTTIQGRYRWKMLINIPLNAKLDCPRSYNKRHYMKWNKIQISSFHFATMFKLQRWPPICPCQVTHIWCWNIRVIDHWDWTVVPTQTIKAPIQLCIVWACLPKFECRERRLLLIRCTRHDYLT